MFNRYRCALDMPLINVGLHEITSTILLKHFNAFLNVRGIYDC